MIMNNNYKDFFYTTSPGSNEEFMEKVLSKKAVKRKLKLKLAYVPVLTLAAVIGLIVFGNYWRDNSNTVETGGLQVGRWEIDSDYWNMYIEVYDDDTLQFFGLDWNEVYEYYSAEALGQNIQELNEYIAKRGYYSVSYDRVMFSHSLGKGGVMAFHFSHPDENTIMVYVTGDENGDTHLVFKFKEFKG
jgi:hypothetical protein